MRKKTIKEKEIKLQLSTSRIQSYLHCPKKYWWTYLQNLVPKVTARPLKVGGVVHDLLEKYNKGELTQSFLNNLLGWVAERYPDVENPEEALDIAAEAANLVLGYLRTYEDDPFEIVSPEVHLELERKDYILYTRLDNLCRGRDGRLWRGEYKTTGRLDSAYLSGLKGGLQSGIAQIILKEVMPERVTGTVYSLLVKTKVPSYHRMPVPLESGLIPRTEECIKGVVRGIKEGLFYPSMQCYPYNRECEYLPLCKHDSEATREAFYTERKEYLPKQEKSEEEV